jgi:hypothetical protein
MEIEWGKWFLYSGKCAAIKLQLRRTLVRFDLWATFSKTYRAIKTSALSHIGF